MAHALFLRSHASSSSSPKIGQSLQRQVIHKLNITTKPTRVTTTTLNRLNHFPIRKLTESVPIKQFIGPQQSNVHLKIYNAVARNTINSVKHNSGIFKLVTQAYAARTYHYAKFLMNRIDGIFQRHPLLAGVTVACTKAVLADLFAQTIIERKSLNDLCWSRITLFAVLGVFYNGFCVYGIYAKIYPKLFKPIQHWNTLTRCLKQTTIDVVFHATLIYFPTFYALKSCIFHGFSIENVRGALETYFFHNIWDDFSSTMRVWFPCTLIAFGYVPPYLRTPYMSLISFMWVLVLSVTRGAGNPAKE